MARTTRWCWSTAAGSSAFGLADDGHASYPDLSQLPFDAVERIEVLKDGASAIYGSDAVAGVVNVILRQQFTGFTATGTDGTTSNGAGNQWKVALTGGIGDLTKDKYNAFISFDYQKQDAFASTDAKSYMGSNDLRNIGWWDQRLGNPNILGTSSADRQRAAGESDHRRLAGRLPVAARAPARRARSSGGFCLYDPKDWTDLTPSIERMNVYARGAYNFTPSVQGYTELSYFSVEDRHAQHAVRHRAPTGTTRRTTPSSRRSTSSCRSAIRTTRSMPPTRARGLYYVDAALGGRDGNYETDTQRYLLGLKGANGGLGLGHGRPVPAQRHQRHPAEFLQLRPAAAGPGGHQPLRLLPDRRQRRT